MTPSKEKPITPDDQGEGSVTGWQPIETAPKDGTDILVCVTHNLSADEWETKQWVDWRVPGIDWPVYRDRIDIPFPPTHWQPLPEPPSALPSSLPEREQA